MTSDIERVSFGGDENVLKLEILVHRCEYTKTSELYI